MKLWWDYMEASLSPAKWHLSIKTDGTVKWVSAFGLSNNKWRCWMLGLQPIGGLTAQVGWLGLKVGGQLALPIHSSNEPSELLQWLCHDDSTINKILLLLLVVGLSVPQFYPEWLSYDADAMVDIHCWWQWVYESSKDKCNILLAICELNESAIKE